MNTMDLTGWRLDYFTGLAMGYGITLVSFGEGVCECVHAGRGRETYSPTDCPENLIPVLLKMITILRGWQARAVGCSEFARGDTLPVAVCRALVLAAYGPTVPDIVGYKNDSVVPDACEDLFA